MNGQFVLLGIVSSITSPTVIAIAVVVLALVVAIGAFLVYRSGGKKGAKATASASNNDWQRQAQGQPGGANGWNQQGMNNDAPAWSQQSQGQPGGWNNQGSQQGWNAPQQNGQMQPQNANSWNPQQGTGPSWGDAQMPGVVPQPPAAWGSGVQNGQQSAGNQWAAAANPGMQPANQWDAQNNPNSMGGGRPAWDGVPAQSPADPWNKPATASPQPQWAGQANGVTPQPSQQAPTAFGGGSGAGWNQQGFAGAGQNGQSPQAGQGMDWGGPQQPQYAPQGASNSMGGFNGNATQAPSWQQQQGGFNPGVPGMQPNQSGPFGNMDGDKTIMRPTGGLGLVRVEEGKEPGREYKIVKESLSIGRSRESDIFLEDLAVSRLHASVVNLGNGQYALKDEGSANGTKVNGQLVGKFQTFPLQEGDRIQLGQTVLVFARG